LETSQALQLELLNSLGQVQKVVALEKGDNQMATTGLSSGIYFLKNASGKTQKIILQ
jgi:hypothetical protein